MGNTFNKVVVAIHAHPDDTEAFCAGTLALLKKCGYTIYLTTMSAGGMGGVNSTENKTIDLRLEEARKAAGALGAEYHCFNQRDGYIFDNEEIRIEVLRYIREVKAGIVMTHLPNDYHADHRATCSIVDAATMLATLPNAPMSEAPLDVTPLLYHTAPLGFSNPLGEDITMPHFYVDISSVIETKMEMLSCHQTQIDLMRIMHKMDNFFDEMKSYNKDLGEMIGVEYAECMWQHLGGGYQKDPLLQNEISEFIKYTTKE